MDLTNSLFSVNSKSATSGSRPSSDFVNSKNVNSVCFNFMPGGAEPPECKQTSSNSQEDNAARKRRMKEAKTSLFRKYADGKHTKVFNPIGTDALTAQVALPSKIPPSDNSVKEDEEAESLELEPPSVCHQFFEGCDYYFDIKSKELRYESEPSLECPICIDYKSSKFGTSGLPQVILKRDFIETFSYFGINFEGSDCVYSPILLNFLLVSGKLGTSQHPRNYNSMVHHLQSTYSSFPVKILMDTLKAACVMLSKTTVVNQPESFETVVACIKYLNTDAYEAICGIEEEATLCNYGGFTHFNLNWSIEGKNGFSFDFCHDYTEGVAEVLTPPQFKTPDDDSRQVVLNFFRIIPSNRFEHYRKCGFNCGPALSRYFKARDGEYELQSNQLSLLRLLQDPNRVLSLACASIIKEETYEAMVTRKIRLSSEARPRSRTVEISGLDHPYCREAFYQLTSIPRWYWMHRVVRKIVEKGIKFFNTLGPSLARCFWVTVAVSYDKLMEIYELSAFSDRAQYIKEHAALPHPKRTLYQQWALDEDVLNSILHQKFLWESKIKWENGKALKAPRLYGSAGAYCLYDRVAPEVSKAAFKRQITLRSNLGLRLEIIFSAAQEVSESDALFKWFSETPFGVVRAAFFSDDHLVAYNLDHSVAYLEGDISSCDSGNGPAIFCLVHEILRAYSDEVTADALVGQCTHATTLRNPSNSEEFVNLKPLTFFEYSGSVLTTLLNNTASLMILSSFLESTDIHPTQGLAWNYTEGAKRVGHVVTVSEFHSPEKATFLKRACTLVDNTPRSFLVLGTILRSFGSIDTVMSASTLAISHREFKTLSEEQKMHMYCRQILSGLVNEPGHLVLNALRVRFGLPVTADTIPLDALISRYGGNPHEWAQFAFMLEEIQLGTVIRHEIADRIFSVDYGVPPP